MSIKIDTSKVNSFISPNLEKSYKILNSSYDEIVKLRTSLPISFQYRNSLVIIQNNISAIKKDVKKLKRSLNEVVNMIEQIERKRETKFNDLALGVKQITIPTMRNKSSFLADTSTSSTSLLKRNVDKNKSLLSKIAEELRNFFGLFIVNGENPDEFLKYDYKKIDYSKIEKDGYVVQGVTTIDGKYAISAYKKNCKSRVYVYDCYGEYEGCITLDSKAHVGGITYDKVNKILFVAGVSGTVDAYNYELLLAAAEKAKNKKIPYTIDLNKLNEANDDIKLFNNQKIMDRTTVNRTSTIYFDGTYLYAATCSGIGPGELVKFKVTYDNNKKNINYVQEGPIISVPEQTQGIAVTKHKGKEYLIVSQSMGEKIDSRVLLYELNESSKKTYIGKYYTPIEGYEGVQVEADGTVIFVSEFSEKNVLTTMDEVISKAKKNEKNIGNYLTDTAAFFAGFGYEVLTPLGNGFSGAWNKLKKGDVKEAFSKVGDGIEASWEGLKDTGGVIIRNTLGDDVASFVSDAVNVAEDFVSDTANYIGKGINDAGSYIAEKADVLWNSIF